MLPLNGLDEKIRKKGRRKIVVSFRDARGKADPNNTEPNTTGVPKSSHRHQNAQTYPAAHPRSSLNGK